MTTVERLQALNDFLINFARDSATRNRMTFREFQVIFLAKQKELEVDLKALNSQEEHDPDVSTWLFEIAMSLDHGGFLVDEDHHLDLPLNFQWMPQYDAMREAEEAFWNAHKGTPFDADALEAIVRKYAPAKATVLPFPDRR